MFCHNIQFNDIIQDSDRPVQSVQLLLYNMNSCFDNILPPQWSALSLDDGIKGRREQMVQASLQAIRTQLSLPSSIARTLPHRGK